MRSLEFFSSIPFPFRIQKIDTQESILESNGIFFDTPNYKEPLNPFFQNIKTDGWTRCPNGYSIYSRKIPSLPNFILIIHGLKIQGEWKSRGRDNSFSIISPREKIVKFVDNVLQAFINEGIITAEKIDLQVKTLVTDSIHEIRSMNTSLYHAAYELQGKVLYDKHMLPLAKNVVALSELMSSRIELADLLANEDTALSEIEHSQVIVFRKFDKIVRCYIAYAKRREIDISLTGASNSSIRGISNFEMIPLIVLDNAVKYSPSKNSVSVNIIEDNNLIVCKIKSLGPKIEDHEVDQLFNRQFRGVHAISSGQDGSGIGLAFLKILITEIRGNVTVSQENQPTSINTRIYYPTEFTLEFPKK